MNDNSDDRHIDSNIVTNSLIRLNIFRNTFKLLDRDNKVYSCVRCNRTEHDLVGSTINTVQGKSIFSPEMLCIDCEILCYPSRFHGCAFCKRPLKTKFCCSICSDGFVSWVHEMIHPVDTVSRLIRMSAHNLIDKMVSDLPVENRQFILRNDDGLYRWPGFYAGITNRFSYRKLSSVHEEMTKNSQETKEHQPVTIEIDMFEDNNKVDDIIDLDLGLDSVYSSRKNKKEKIDKTLTVHDEMLLPVWIVPKLTKMIRFDMKKYGLDLRMFEKVLLDILKENNINLYSYIQIDSDTIGGEQIKTVNPHDTRVIKR